MRSSSTPRGVHSDVQEAVARSEDKERKRKQCEAWSDSRKRQSKTVEDESHPGDAETALAGYERPTRRQSHDRASRESRQRDTKGAGRQVEPFAYRGHPGSPGSEDSPVYQEDTATEILARRRVWFTETFRSAILVSQPQVVQPHLRLTHAAL